MPRFIVPYEGLNAPSHSFIISITMTFGLFYKIKMTIKVRPPYSWNYPTLILPLSSLVVCIASHSPCWTTIEFFLF